MKDEEIIAQIYHWIQHLKDQLENSNVSPEVKIFHMGITIGRIQDILATKEGLSSK